MTDAPIFIGSLLTSLAFGKGSERVRYVLCLLGVFGMNTEHTGSVRAVRKTFGNNTEIREKILETIGKHSSCSRNIRHVPKANSTHCL